MEFLLIWVGFAVVSGVIASGKGRSGIGWFVLGVFFGIFALIAVAFLPSLRPEEAAHQSHPLKASPVATKACIDCGETILAAANVCKHCGFRYRQPPA
jgi:ribosomal protein L32